MPKVSYRHGETYFSAMISKNMIPISAHQPIDNFRYSGIDCKKNMAIMNTSTIPDLTSSCGFFIGYYKKQGNNMQITKQNALT